MAASAPTSYYRLAVFSVFVPPLRDRSGDIALLAEHFVKRFCQREEKKARKLDAKALQLLHAYDYPGNVRELENVLSYAVVSSRGELLTIADMPPSFLRSVSRYRDRIAAASGEAPAAADPTALLSNQPIETLAEMERKHILRALSAADGNKSAAASTLGISRMTLYRKLTEYNLAEGEE